MAKKRFLVIFVFIIFCATAMTKSAFCAADKVAAYLCDVGINFYKAGRYDDALQHFEKALILEPNNQTAKKYINDIFRKTGAKTLPVASIEKEQSPLKKQEKIAAVPATQAPAYTTLALQQLIAEAQKNIQLIDDKIRKEEAKKPQPVQRKPTKEELKKAALEKKQKEIELKRQQAIEKQLAAAATRKKQKELKKKTK